MGGVGVARGFGDHWKVSKARDGDLAIFGRKNLGDDDSGDKSEGKQPEPTGYSPERAQKFFEHAKTMSDTGSHEYAMRLWLSGLRQDPSSMHGLESFLNSAVNFEGKPGKELINSVAGRTDADRYVQAVLAWGLKISEGSLAVKAVQAAAKLNLSEQAYYLGEKALALVRGKPKKGLYIKLMEAFAAVEAFDLAVIAGDAAVQMDPADGPLSTQVKNMSASATMRQGGFDKTGEEGGFRANIKDLDKQRMLDDADRVVKTDETMDRLVSDAEAEFQKRPDDMPTLQKLTKRLLERGRPEDEQRAIRLLMTGFEATKQFRFRQDAGKIRLRQLKRTLLQYQERAEAKPDDEKAQQDYADAKAKYFKIEVSELSAAVEAYPTDLPLKFELGKRYFEAQEYDNAIGLLQEAKGDARFRSQALSLLGRSFYAMEWNDEAIATYQQALDAKSAPSTEIKLELRYGLLCALESKAMADRDLAAAEEAEKLASAIAIEQFSYRDIRDRREALKQLVRELKQG